MSHSITQAAVTHISRAVFAQHLKAAGFKRRSNHLFRKHVDVVHGVHFQASQWNSSNAGNFTINLVVTLPAIYTFYLGRPFPANPATATLPIVERIGFLMPKRQDYWWSISPETDLLKFTTEVCDAIFEYGLPFFNEYSEAKDILHKLRTVGAVPGLLEGLVPIVRAILAKEAGCEEEAKDSIRQALAESEIPDFTARIKVVADRLGLIL